MITGTAVECILCKRTKKPSGRSAPAEMAYWLCQHGCRGYELEPRVGQLWPGETVLEFGYRLGEYGSDVDLPDGLRPAAESEA